MISVKLCVLCVSVVILSEFKTHEMKKLLFLFFLLYFTFVLLAQNSADTVKQAPPKANADDPSQFFTRIEIFNELQHYDKNGTDFYLNQSVFRTIVKIGKNFTTRARTICAPRG